MDTFNACSGTVTGEPSKCALNKEGYDIIINVMKKGYCIQIYVKKEICGKYSVVIYTKGLLESFYIQKQKRYLDNINNWKSGVIHGNRINRDQIWVHNDGTYFGPHWATKHPRWISEIYDNQLIEFQEYVHKIVSDIIDEYNLIVLYGIDPLKINSVLINKYKDGKDGIRPHKDDELIFGDDPTILSVSIGITRKFILSRSYYDKECPKSTKLNLDEKDLNLDFDLESGDILIMAGACQKYYCHEVPKIESTDGEEIGIRYNMTFRNHKIKV
jgi:hypothetical protein